jgi:hypothetical protein
MGLARTLFSRDVLDLLWNATPDELDGLIIQTAGELDVPWRSCTSCRPSASPTTVDLGS